MLFRRTRPYAVVLGLGFHLVSAIGGHSAYSGLAWSFYLLFLPPAVLARVAVAARRAIPEGAVRVLADAVRTPLTLVAPGALWVIWTGGVRLSRRCRAVLPAGGAPRCSACCGWAPGCGCCCAPSPGTGTHLLVPEAVRVFGWQDGEVRFVATDDEVLTGVIAARGSGRTVLVDARRVVAPYPDATVRYVLDGQERIAAPVSADPVFGEPQPPVQRAVGAFRPFSDSGTCQH
ncbi:hypothetical protein ACVGVM_21185 [Pseudonocardia bannensis]|uniref:Uncharacterized protein n=1 Tax=Pseudonocardia bannensis TaxID=630973 RepID=A0A848DEZ9_9PSEU|nr:hypothetical protein [Pseudonocardia bannensis]NMH91159.1 hypothetical protein [Pseudonocardia bannensis]